LKFVVNQRVDGETVIAPKAHEPRAIIEVAGIVVTHALIHDGAIALRRVEIAADKAEIDIMRRKQVGESIRVAKRAGGRIGNVFRPAAVAAVQENDLLGTGRVDDQLCFGATRTEQKCQKDQGGGQKCRCFPVQRGSNSSMAIDFVGHAGILSDMSGS
jgi:hypothetical protein